MLVVDSKNVMIETKSILKYFAEKYCENELLYPSNRRDEIDAALSFVLDELGSLVDEVYVSRIIKPTQSITLCYICSTLTYSNGILDCRRKFS